MAKKKRTNTFLGPQATGLTYMGGNTWAGWSGSVNATQGTDGTLYDFQSPNEALKAIASFSFDENNLNANAFLGLKIKMNGIIIYNMRVKKSSDAGFTNLDSDSICFCIPPLTTVLITTFTDDTDNIGTAVNLVCTEV
jgi:hypothetical protein